MTRPTRARAAAAGPGRSAPGRAPRTVLYTNFPAQFAESRDELLAVVERVLAGGQFILGAEVEAFEREFARLCGTPDAVGVANGTDALALALRALGVGPGDDVITAPNSFLATAAAIVQVGGRPVFVDVRDDLNIDPDRIAAAVTGRTRAIIPVHLTGRCADMDPILEIAQRHALHVVEDAAQAVGAVYRGRRAGSFGATGCFSLHPLKNLNAVGDAGVITTSDAGLAARLRRLRNHGLATRDEAVEWGFNSRLDALQAAVLRFRLGQVPGVTAARRQLADRYRATLAGVVECPEERPWEQHVYHLFVVQGDQRDDLQRFLAARGIDTKVHYPVPIHLQPCAKNLGYARGDFPVAERQASRILSLPVHQWLDEADVEHVAASIREFYGR